MAEEGGKKSDRKRPKKEEDTEQPRVFKFSEAEMEELLRDKDQITAGVEKKPKKPPPPEKKEAAPATEELEAIQKRAEERDKFLDRLQRLQAEYVNYQKRMKRERAEWGDQTLKGFLESILPLLDDFDGARRTIGGGSAESVAKGIEILRGRLWKILTDHGVSEIATDGVEFDPKVHEAVAQETSPDAEDGEILEVLQKGYMYKEWVLRASRVKIARKGEAEAAPAEPEAAKAAPPMADTHIPAPAVSHEPEAAPPPTSGNPLLDEPDEQPHG